MAQRELKVKVTADMSASFKKLINMLEKPQKLNVKVNVSDGGLKKMTDKLNKLANKKVSVKVNAESKHLDRLSKKLDGLKDKKVSIKADSTGLDSISGEIDKAKNKADELSNTKVSPIGVAAGLAPLMVTLDQISDKILSIANQTIAPVVKDTWSDSMDLFDAQKSFELGMDSIGKSKDWIAEQTKALNDYGKQSKYSVAEMTDAFSSYYAAGNEDAMDLVKGIAGISSYASNASSAMKSVNTQLRQMTDDSKVFNGDWNRIENAVGGAAMKSIKEWLKVNKGFEYSKKALSEGQLEARDFKDAIIAVGNEDRFQAMATNVSTVSTALDNLKESLVTSLVGDSINPGPLRDVFQSLIGIIKDFADEVPNFTKDIAKGVEFLKDTFGKAFKDFSAKDFLSGLKESFEGVAPTIKLVADVIGKLTNNGKDTGKVIGNLIKFAVGWKMFRGLAQPVLSLASAGATLLKVAQGFGALKGGGIFSKLFGKFGTGGRGGKSFDVGKIKAQALNTAKNIGTILAVIGTVWVGAKALESVSKMDIDLSSLAKNLGAVALGLTASGAYISAIGKAMEKWPSLQSKLLTGSIALAGVAGVMLAVSKAVEMISAMKINVSSLAVNLTATLVGLTAAGGLITGIGGLLAVFPLAVPLLEVGSIALMAVAGVMVVISSSIKKVSDNVVKISDNIKKIGNINMPDKGDLNEKLDYISDIVSKMSKTIGSKGFWGSLKKMFTSGFDAKTSENIVAQFTNLLGLINKLNKTPKVDSEKIEKKLEGITGALDALNGVKLESYKGLPTENLAKVSTAVKSIKTIADSFKGLPADIDFSSTQKAISGITNILAQPFMTSFRGAMANLGSIDVDVKTAKSLISSLTTIANVLRDVPADIDFTTTGDVISKITEQVNKLAQDGEGNYGFKSAIDNLGDGEVDIKGAKALIKSIGDIANVLRSVPADIDFAKTGEVIDNITKQVKKLATSSKEGAKDSFKAIIQQLGKGKVDIEGAKSLINSITDIANVLRSVPADIEFGQTETAITKITATVKKLATSQDKDGIGFKQAVKLLGKGKVDVDGAVNLVNAITTLANSLLAVPVIDSTIVDTTISSIVSSLNNLTNEDGLKSAIIKLTEDDLPNKIETANTVISTISTLVTTLNSIPEVGDVETKMTAIAKGIEAIAGVELNEEALAKVDNIVVKIQEIIGQLQLYTINFTNIGTSYANSLVEGFSNNIDPLYTKFKDIKDKIEANSDLTAIGKKMSTTLSDGFNADGLIQKINDIQAAIDSLKGKTVTININEVTTKSTVRRANGGIIPEYHSTGGRVGGRLFRKRGTDTVPAMLTPGEYVLKRSVSSALGKGFLDALNNMNLSSAMAKLQNKVAGNNITNNTYNNITQNVDNKASYLNGLGSIRRVVRT